MTQLVPYVFQNATGTLPLSELDTNLEYVSGKVLSVKDDAYGAVGDGVTDDTAAIQAAVNAAAGARLFFPPGAYKITAAINITTKVFIYAAPFSATIYMGTANQNGFVIGDGTAATRSSVPSTYIVGLQFAVAAGVAVCISGACILASRANNFVIRDCSFYGLLSATKTLYNAISVDRCLAWVIERCIFTNFVNNGIRCVGASAAADLVVDGRIDFIEIANTDGDAIYFGDYTAAITVTSPIIYSCGAWGIKIDCTAAAGVGINFMIFQPDIEITTSTGADGGVYAKQCASGQIVGGWIGGVAALQVDSTAGSFHTIGVLLQISGSTGACISLSGAACSLVGCDIVGDGAVATTGVAIASTATDTLISGCRIRQWTTAGVAFAGSPARCNVLANHFRSNAADLTGVIGDINTSAAPKGSTTPTPTSGAGTFTTVAAAVSYTKGSDRVDVDITVTITTNGTAATSVKVPLPFTPAAVTGLAGNESQATGTALTGYFNTDGNAYIFLYDGTYPGANGRTLRVAGSYRV